MKSKTDITARQRWACTMMAAFHRHRERQGLDPMYGRVKTDELRAFLGFDDENWETLQECLKELVKRNKKG